MVNDTMSRLWPEGEVHREYLKLTTTDGLLCEIFFDLIHERWCLARLYD